MKLSRSSWHYRFLTFAERCDLSPRGVLPTDLCSYFWTLVFAAFMITVAGMLLAAVAVIALVGSPLLLVAGGCVYLWKRFGVRRNGEPNFTRPPSLFGAWLRAKKDKVCPLIEWED